MKLGVIGQTLRNANRLLLQNARAALEMATTGRGGIWLKQASATAQKALVELHTNCQTVTPQSEVAISSIRHPGFARLQARCEGLHLLLHKRLPVSFSLLMPVCRPDPGMFRAAMVSCLNQTSPDFELLLGYDGPQPQAVTDMAADVIRENPAHAARVRQFTIPRAEHGGGISRTTNVLADKAKGDYVLLVDHDDWIRPDLLYRYHQSLFRLAERERTVLYCDETKIDEAGAFIPNTTLLKPDKPPFPFLFINLICHGLLIPAGLWKQVAGLRPACDGAQDYDLVLRLDGAGAAFLNVPFALYAWRSHRDSTAHTADQKPQVNRAGIRALQDYADSKGLAWTIGETGFPSAYRAEPVLDRIPRVQIVVPFKDHKELTLAAVESLRGQSGVEIAITAVDNNSADASIAVRLKQMGVEVIHVPEPFNYSRLNNLAVESSGQTGPELVLFMNNDVVLEPGALLEMSRWALQPGVGMVGCLLCYPDGSIQHAGVYVDPTPVRGYIAWSHRGQCAHKDVPTPHDVVLAVDAVTAACAMVKRSRFLEAGGFDEIHYPIAFSDTDLCTRLAKLNYVSLYTPFARGIHHESKSRGYGVLEDYEGSAWLAHRRNLAPSRVAPQYVKWPYY
jgi:O-antigen biosynthesis protein